MIDAATMNVSDLARALDVCTATVRRMADVDGMPAYRLPGRKDRRFNRMDVVEWMACRPRHHGMLERLCGPLPPGWPKPQMIAAEAPSADRRDSPCPN